MNFYSQYFLDHAKKPRNTGSLIGATHKAILANASCGDATKIELKIENCKLKIVRHQTDGCMVAKFSASVLSEKLGGKTAEEILEITPEELTKILGVTFTMSRLKCAMLPLMAIRKALNSKN